MNSTKTPNFLADLDAAPPVRVSSFLPDEIPVIEVKSSLIAAIGYDELSSRLQVNFTDGAIWQYAPVPVWQWTNFQTAKSIGKFFLQNIKDAGYTAIQIKAGNNKPTMTVTPSIDTMGAETAHHIQTLGEKVVEAMSAEAGFKIEGNYKINLTTGEATELEDEEVAALVPNISTLDKQKLFAKGGTKYLTDLVEAAVKNVPTTINSRQDKAKIRSEAFAISKIKAALKNTKLEYTKPWRDLVSAANDETNLAEAALIDLHARVRKPLTDLEDKERNRKGEHEAKITAIEGEAFVFANADSHTIACAIEKTFELHADWDFEEYTVKAGLVRNEKLAALRAQLTTAQTNEENARQAKALAERNAELERELQASKVREQTLQEVKPQIAELQSTVQRQADVITSFAVSAAPVAAPVPIQPMPPPAPVVTMDRKIQVHTEIAEDFRAMQLSEDWIQFLMNNIIAGNVRHLRPDYTD